MGCPTHPCSRTVYLVAVPRVAGPLTGRLRCPSPVAVGVLPSNSEVWTGWCPLSRNENVWVVSRFSQQLQTGVIVRLRAFPGSSSDPDRLLSSHRDPVPLQMFSGHFRVQLVSCVDLCRRHSPRDNIHSARTLSGVLGGFHTGAPPVRSGVESAVTAQSVPGLLPHKSYTGQSDGVPIDIAHCFSSPRSSRPYLRPDIRCSGC